MDAISNYTDLNVHQRINAKANSIIHYHRMNLRYSSNQIIMDTQERIKPKALHLVVMNEGDPVYERRYSFESFEHALEFAIKWGATLYPHGDPILNP